jgi:all-trans-retinol 13,14-reductase
VSGSCAATAEAMERTMNLSQHFDSVVIGSGMGGMAAARMLAEFGGKRVLLLEQHYSLGGMTHEFSRGRYRFATGLHYLGASTPEGEPSAFLQYLSDGRAQWQRLPGDYDVLHLPGCDFPVPSSEPEFRKRLKALFPNQCKAIDSYFDALQRAAGGLLARHVVSSLPSGIRKLSLLLIEMLYPGVFRSIREQIEPSIREPELRAVLSARWGLYGPPPAVSAFGFHALVTTSYARSGAIYPVGGPGELGQLIIEGLEHHGVVLRVRQKVQSIVIERGRATGVDVEDGPSGTRYVVRAPCVVSAIGARNTSMLLPQAQAAPWEQELAAFPKGLATLLLFLGFRESPAKFELRGENHWFMPDLDDDEGFKRPPGDGIVYASFGSLNNPAARHHVAEVMQLIDPDAFAEWFRAANGKRPYDYQQLKTEVSTRLIERLERQWPGFKANIAFAELATPLTFEDYQGSAQGAFYGLPTTARRLLSSVARPITPVKGLFLAGQDACGPGIEGALAGGILAANAALTGKQKLRMWKALHSGTSRTRPAAPWRGYMRVAKVEQLTPSVKRFRLAPLNGSRLPFSFEAGQYIKLDIPVAGKTIERMYSISSPPSQSEYLDICVKREPQGLGSNFLHDEVEAGQAFRLTGPLGEFTCDLNRTADAGRLLLIAGGVGMTPMMSVLGAAADAAYVGPISLVASFRSQTEILFKREIAEFRNRLPLAVSILVTGDDPSWCGPRGRINSDMLRPHTEGVAHVHLCGPTAMMQAAMASLTKLGVRRDLIQTEVFASSQSGTSLAEKAHRIKAVARETGVGQFQIEQRDGQWFSCLPGQTVLAAANAARVPFSQSCGEGHCGKCQTRVISGTFETGISGLFTAEQLDAGWVLACQTLPTADMQIYST